MEKKPPIQICEGCQTSFQNPWMRRSRFCSMKCRDRARHQAQLHDPKYRELRRVEGRAKYWANKERHQMYMKRWRRKSKLAILAVQPWLTLLTSARHSAKSFGLDHDLDNEWAISRWTGKCEVCHLPFATLEKRLGYKLKNFSPSIDRIDPTKGYLKDNCRFVLLAVNTLKRDGPEEEMYLIAKAIADNMSPPAAISIDGISG